MLLNHDIHFLFLGAGIILIGRFAAVQYWGATNSQQPTANSISPVKGR
jgi:hypothetical protein